MFQLSEWLKHQGCSVKIGICTQMGAKKRYCEEERATSKESTLLSCLVCKVESSDESVSKVLLGVGVIRGNIRPRLVVEALAWCGRAVGSSASRICFG